MPKIILIYYWWIKEMFKLELNQIVQPVKFEKLNNSN